MTRFVRKRSSRFQQLTPVAGKVQIQDYRK